MGPRPKKLTSSICFPLYIHERTLLPTSGSSESCQNPTWRQSSSSCRLLGDFAGAFYEEARQRAECAIFKRHNPNRLRGNRQFYGQGLEAEALAVELQIRSGKYCQKMSRANESTW